MPSLCNHILKGIDQLQLSLGVLENLINDFGRMPDEEFLPLASFLLFFLSFLGSHVNAGVAGRRSLITVMLLLTSSQHCIPTHYKKMAREISLE